MLPGWAEAAWLLCAVDFGSTYWPAVSLWPRQDLLFVTTRRLCWAVRTTTAAVAFRVGALYAHAPEVFPDQQHVLRPTELSPECVGPTGEVEWWCHADPPYEHRILPDGDVYLRYLFDDECRAEVLDRWTGAAKAHG